MAVFRFLHKAVFETLWFSVKGLCRKPQALRKIGIFALVMAVLFLVSQFSAYLLAGHLAYANTDNALPAPALPTSSLSVSALSISAFLVSALRWSWLPLSLVFLIIKYGEIAARRRYRDFFMRHNIFGIDGMCPKYVKKAEYNSRIEIVRFKSLVHPEEWKKQKNDLEMLFKSDIYDLISYKNPKTLKEDITIMDILVIKEKLPNFIIWQDEFMLEGRNFAIGEGYMGQVVWNAAELSHGIVAGATGSGKTALLRCIIHQAIQKGYSVSILDFKDGGDFSGMESEYDKHRYVVKNQQYLMVSNVEKARELLDNILIEVSGRLEYFKQAGVSNIDEFNVRPNNTKNGPPKFNPWLVVIDEAAEILDVKPKDKAEKELYAEIDSSLRTLARTSRAAGIHILMGVIRPDSNILDGQIKNNLLWRVCGYFADSPASRIVLDNDKATELPPDVKGRFIIGDDEVQAYYMPLPRQEMDGNS